VPCSVVSRDLGALEPVVGELFLMHVGLGGFAIGEATLAQLPDGTRVIMDVGNNSHSDDIVDAIDDVFGDRAVDVVLLTHHHADHEDGLTKLLDDVAVGLVVHRGFTDVSDAANDATVQALCDARPRAAQLELCTTLAGGCGADEVSEPAAGCAGIGRDFGDGALTVIAANAVTIDNFRYERLIGPLNDVDNNGENARSVVVVLAHGAFRAVYAGDLTGGGSDTDPVEAFLVEQLGARLPAVDVMHVSHHGRDTSSSAAWLNALLPADGRPRTAVTGISTAHVGSPHTSVVDAVVPRLGDGDLWVTRVAAGGEGSDVINAGGGSVRIRTVDGGARYLVQAVDDGGDVLRTVEVSSGAACIP